MSRHVCHARNCTTSVPEKMFMCRRHWYMLPFAMRQRVWAAYTPGQEITKTPSPEYLRVARLAIRVVAAKEKVSART